MLGTANGAGSCTNPCIPALRLWARSRAYKTCHKSEKERALASAAGCRPNGAPCGAARGRRKSPKGGAQDARQFAACTWMCIQRTPEPAREPGGQDARKARYLGCVSFGDFSLHKQRKVTRSPAGRVEALHFKGKIKMDSRLRGNDVKRKELDSGLTSSAVESRRNDEQKTRASPLDDESIRVGERDHQVGDAAWNLRILKRDQVLPGQIERRARLHQCGFERAW